MEMQKNCASLSNRIEELERSVIEIQQPSQIQQAITTHKSLYENLRTLELSLDGRKECRSALEQVWGLLAEKKQEFGRSRFSADRLDETLASLENAGYFLWMRQIPKIA
jgi:hypothetical protein